jgi:restriction system protein
MRNEFLSTITSRSLEQVEQLLRWFLFGPSTFGSDERGLVFALHRRQQGSQLYEYDRRLLGKRSAPAHEGVRWVVDLVRDRPQAAMKVIEAYLYTDGQFLPDGRIDGLQDALDVIRAWYIQAEHIDAEEALRRLSPRGFEELVERLYQKLGYQTTLTPATRDGGRDIIARRDEPGHKSVVLVECKHYTGVVGVSVLRQVLGVASHERSTSAAVVTSGRFSRTALELAEAEPRLDLIDRRNLAALLNSHMSSTWLADPTGIERGSTITR